ncbi:murein tripeptide amidase MpaA [soil metagenome]
MVETAVAGVSVEGRPLEIQTLGTGAETVMVLASIHGNEPAGTPLVGALVAELDRDSSPLQGLRLVIVPVVNPDGLARGERLNANGVDLNRNFPSTNRGTRERFGAEGLSEPESATIFRLLEDYRPARIVSIHQPLACVDWDGPALALAKAMAARCELPLRRLGSRPGSLGSYAGMDLKIPIVTLELRPGDEQLAPEALWDLYGGALMAFVTFDGG